MIRKYALALVAVLAFVVGGCATPSLLGSGGGAATAQDADGKNGTLEPQAALLQPGVLGSSVTQSKLAYQRQSTGTQTAPSMILNLQPASGATVAATYPALASISPIFVVVMGNSQVEPTLSKDQIDAIANATDKAGVAVKGVLDASAKTPAVVPVAAPPK